jgi:hypothetical protein
MEATLQRKTSEAIQPLPWEQLLEETCAGPIAAPPPVTSSPVVVAPKNKRHRRYGFARTLYRAGGVAGTMAAPFHVRA